MEPIVQFVGAGVSLGGRRILTGLEMSVAPGAALGVVGPNGSGKTTLTRAAAALIKTDSGSTRILGVDPSHDDPSKVRRSIGLIGHQPALIGELTLTENLDHFARLGGWERAKVSNALDVVGLGEVADRRVTACSFGMQRRAEIAHLLISRPKLLLLDEASVGLDETAHDLVAALIRAVRERDGAVIMVSHDRDEMEDVCDTVATLEHGKLNGAW